MPDVAVRLQGLNTGAMEYGCGSGIPISAFILVTKSKEKYQLS